MATEMLDHMLLRRARMRIDGSGRVASRTSVFSARWISGIAWLGIVAAGLLEFQATAIWRPSVAKLLAGKEKDRPTGDKKIAQKMLADGRRPRGSSRPRMQRSAGAHIGGPRPRRPIDARQFGVQAVLVSGSSSIACSRAAAAWIEASMFVQLVKALSGNQSELRRLSRIQLGAAPLSGVKRRQIAVMADGKIGCQPQPRQRSFGLINIDQ